MNKNIWFLLQIIAVVVNVLIGFVYARNFFQKELFSKNE